MPDHHFVKLHCKCIRNYFHVMIQVRIVSMKSMKPLIISGRNESVYYSVFYMAGISLADPAMFFYLQCF